MIYVLNYNYDLFNYNDVNKKYEYDLFINYNDICNRNYFNIN